MQEKKKINVYTTSSGAELNISTTDLKQVVSATNNRAQYYAEQSKKYRDEAKLHRDNAKYYAEQNSDVTFEYINTVKTELQRLIDNKQDVGNYALKEELPTNVSEFQNDAEYVNKSEMNSAIRDVELPSQEGCAGMVLVSDGQKEAWQGVSTFKLFDTKISDHIFTGEEAIGWALQGTYVSKSLYPDFYNQCLSQKLAGSEVQLTLAEEEITMYINANGHQFYDISDKAIVDDFFNIYGIADFYGVDTENERIFLPRNNYFLQLTIDTTLVNKFNEAGLPNVQGQFSINAPWANPSGAFYSLSLPTTRLGGEQGNTINSLGFDASLSNSIYGKASTVQPNSSNKLLYYCVGNTLVNTSLIDVGDVLGDITLLNSEKLNADHSNDTKPYVTETYHNGSSWYRIWSDGWCEQGGKTNSAVSNISITLLVAMADDTYTVLAQNLAASYSSNTSSGNKNTIAGYSAIVYEQTTSSFNVRTTTEVSINSVSWYVAGYKNS